MSFIVIIPARYESTRLPGKPLKDIAGTTMIQRVWQQACKSSASRVVIATDDQRIQQVASAFGAEVCMTRGDHVSGTDRLQDVAQSLQLNDEQLVVNVQGDEPLIPPAVIDQVADNLEAHAIAGVSTLSEPINDIVAFNDPNVVKVVANSAGMANYFSRASIPWPRVDVQDESGAISFERYPKRHIGIYAYRVSQLNAFVGWPVAPTEQAESLEQLRFLWNGVAIHVADAVEKVPGGIDTEKDLEAISALFE
jgi:3-deoxy-manno-octulosonate cytidylyltransferase (CMP-KDO synthetase)